MVSRHTTGPNFVRSGRVVKRGEQTMRRIVDSAGDAHVVHSARVAGLRDAMRRAEIRARLASAHSSLRHRVHARALIHRR